MSGNGQRNPANPATAAWLTSGMPCPVMDGALSYSTRLLASAEDSREEHKYMLRGQLELLRHGEEGHVGAAYALQKFKAAYLAQHTPNGGQSGGQRWNRALNGAKEKVAETPTAPEKLGCCGPRDIPDLSWDPVPPGSGGGDEDLFVDGEMFLSIDFASQPPLWGAPGGANLWERGESLMPVGPPGVGKSTLAHLLVWGWLGLRQEVLGWPISPQPGNVLYLAMDRPRQISRAMNRLVRPAHRPVLRERLIVRKGPLPVDILRNPRWLLDVVVERGVGLIVIDSLKDVVPNLSDEEAAARYNAARQFCLAAEIQWLELHHNRKATGLNKEPDTLDDVYGNRQLTAGAGSVVSLFGQPGDTVVSLKQLKAPAEEIFPTQVLIDKDAGLMTPYEAVGLECLVELSGRSGVSPAGLAEKLFSTTKPSSSQVENVRTRLKRLVRVGTVEEFTSVVDGKQRFRHCSLPDKSPDSDSDSSPRQSRQNEKSAGQSHQTGDQTVQTPDQTNGPLLREAVVWEAREEAEAVAGLAGSQGDDGPTHCRSCGTPLFLRHPGRDLCAKCNSNPRGKES